MSLEGSIRVVAAATAYKITPSSPRAQSNFFASIISIIHTFGILQAGFEVKVCVLYIEKYNLISEHINMLRPPVWVWGT